MIAAASVAATPAWIRVAFPRVDLVQSRNRTGTRLATSIPAAALRATRGTGNAAHRPFVSAMRIRLVVPLRSVRKVAPLPRRPAIPTHAAIRAPTVTRTATVSASPTASAVPVRIAPSTEPVFASAMAGATTRFSLTPTRMYRVQLRQQEAFFPTPSQWVKLRPPSEPPVGVCSSPSVGRACLQTRSLPPPG